jgi:hypothetical protein
MVLDFGRVKFKPRLTWPALCSLALSSVPVAGRPAQAEAHWARVPGRAPDSASIASSLATRLVPAGLGPGYSPEPGHPRHDSGQLPRRWLPPSSHCRMLLATAIQVATLDGSFAGSEFAMADCRQCRPLGGSVTARCGSHADRGCTLNAARGSGYF